VSSACVLEIGRPKAGETAAVATVPGAVGAVVGQIAKLKGCHVVGIAGGPDKCVVEELGFDAFVHQLEATWRPASMFTLGTWAATAFRPAGLSPAQGM
jgi:NADPH-dependent curcumin reductase CurA